MIMLEKYGFSAVKEIMHKMHPFGLLRLEKNYNSLKNNVYTFFSKEEIICKIS